MGETSTFEAPRPLGPLGGVVLAVSLFVGLFTLSKIDYLVFHSITEMVSVLVIWGIFVLAYNTRHMVSNPYLIILGAPQLFVGGVLLLHALAYKGMGVFVGHGYTAELATQLWILTRMLAAGSVLVAGLSLRSRIRPAVVFTGFGVVTIAALISIFALGNFPSMYVEGVGLTRIKIVSEYIIMAIAATGLVLLWRNRDRFEPRVVRLIAGAIALMIAAELAFTLYVDVYGFLNFLGHYLSLMSFIMIYIAIIETALVRPYNLLFYELKQLQESEHEIAETLQSALLMAPEHVDTLEMGHAYVSATGAARIGGDFFDLFTPAPGLVAFVVGDVCGKGIKAAVHTAMVRTTLRSFAYDNPDPVVVLKRANATLFQQFASDKFATVIYGVLVSATGHMRLASAGHPDPVYCWEEGALCIDIPRNPPLSVVEDHEYEAVTLQVADGGTMVLFTDGLTDAGLHTDPFGTDRVVDHLGEDQDRTPARIAQDLMAEVKFHAGESLADDVAIVVLRYHVPVGAGASSEGAVPAPAPIV